jgi:hypothetical protein
VDEALGRIEGLEREGPADLWVALMHHPLSWLHYEERGEVQRKLRRLGPEARDAGVAAYRNLVERVDRELAAHLPSWVPRGAERLAELRESFNGEVVHLRQRYARVWHRAGVRIDDLQQDLQRMVRERREILRAARRRVRELPAEYRLLGRAEVERLRDALDSMIPAQLPAPA